ncbi:MAG: putative 4-hydroxybenzoate polyprenyltransferase [Deferribacteraceae bacterium]|jgi:4-hydroxybenzoate polyprenyltransferase|nr:putative 4-hydroxybenzoate polyprenyltransferase [Deferribacteraceae bacterium]
MRAVISYLKMIKIEHSLFALPFALSATVLAAKGVPSIYTLFWVVFCMVAARSGAMGFNRWADATIDAKNPRTATREIPKGTISKNSAFIFVVVSFALFMAGAYMLNFLSFALSPIIIGIFILYSYTKRFTSLCHLVLGVALGVSPLAAWVAVTGSFNTSIIYMGVAVVLWCAGFDLFYALQDMEFDKEEGLHSFPARFGTINTMITARYMHLVAFILFFIHGAMFAMGLIYFAGLVISGAMLLYEHYLVSKYGIAKLDKAFFNMNAAVSVILFVATILDLAVYGFRA